jgi:peroxiredoxin/predicted negative regulator of RcsB-dependent stress response
MLMSCLCHRIVVKNDPASRHCRKASQENSRNRLIAAVIIFFIISFSILSVAHAINVKAGDAAPDFTLSSLQDETVSLSKYRGSIVVLVYFNMEQARSRETIKDIQSLFERYRSRGVQVFGITADDGEKESILKMAGKHNFDFPILVDSERNVFGDYGIRVYPSTVIIDKEGNVAYGIPGHSLAYKVQMDGRLRFLLGDINDEELQAVMHPKRVVRDDALLKAERRYNLALTFTRSRLNQQALMTVKQSIMAKPDFVKSHILLGFLLLDEEEADEAYNAFRKALNITPDSKDAMTGLGSALLMKGELDKAIEILKEAASLNPHPERTFYELGKAYSLKGDEERAADMYRKSLEKIFQKHILPTALSQCN